MEKHEHDCIFCKIVNGEISCDKIYENDNFLAFLDIKPIAEGHTLLIPKKHFKSILDVEKEYSAEFLEFIMKVGKILLDKYLSDGFNLSLNNGESAGQVVNHVHFHILPRKIDDNKRGISIG